MSGPLFRSRLAKEFDDRTARFHTSLVEDLRIFEDDINCTTAHDIMLHEQGIIPAKELKLILNALQDMRKRWRSNEVSIGAEYEDVHEYIETKVIEMIGIDAGGMVHMGRSRNDQVVTDIKLRLRKDLLNISEATLNLIEALQRRAYEHTDTLMILYTHGQHAQVGTMGAYLSSYAELRKVHRVIGKAMAGAPHAVWLVPDATTGQNALQQAKAFKEAVAVTGVILSKLDSSARGGFVFAILRELKLPVLFAGLGEKPENLAPFNPDAFVEGILG